MWKVSKYKVISGPYLPVFSPNIGRYGPEITPYLDTFHLVHIAAYIQSTEIILEVIEVVNILLNFAFRLEIQ